MIHGGDQVNQSVCALRGRGITEGSIPVVILAPAFSFGHHVRFMRQGAGDGFDMPCFPLVTAQRNESTVFRNAGWLLALTALPIGREEQPAAREAHDKRTLIAAKRRERRLADGP